MDDNLGDKILKEYMNGTSKSDIITTLNITEQIYDSWAKINKIQLKRINDYMEKQQLKSKLKIRNIPPELNFDSSDELSDIETDSDSDNKFLHKEPGYEHYLPTTDKRIMYRKNHIQDKINKLSELNDHKKIGATEYMQAMNILQTEMDNINKLIELKQVQNN